MKRWEDFTAPLPDRSHRELMIALGAALMATRQASDVATTNGYLADGRIHVEAAVQHLLTVQEILNPRDPS